MECRVGSCLFRVRGEKKQLWDWHLIQVLKVEGR